MGHYRPWTIDPSAAQAHPNGRGEINAFVPDLALRRAALSLGEARSTPRSEDPDKFAEKGERGNGRKMDGRKMRAGEMAAVVPWRWRRDRVGHISVAMVATRESGPQRNENRVMPLFSSSFPFFG